MCLRMIINIFNNVASNYYWITAQMRAGDFLFDIEYHVVIVIITLSTDVSTRLINGNDSFSERQPPKI